MVRRSIFLVAAWTAFTAVMIKTSAAHAAKTFRQATAKDFEEGETTGSTILPTGEIVPGVSTERRGIDAAFVWCSAASRDGATLYLGTGDEGKVFALPTRTTDKRPSGTPKDSSSPPAARLLAKLDTPWVTALMARADGSLLAATTPGAKVVAIDAKTGHTRPFASVPAAHIWAMARDDRASLTYVGTGIPGKIYSISDQGQVKEVWNARDQHVVSLSREADGHLLAGTSDQAILYRVSPTGTAEVIQDFEAEEVRATIRTPAGLYIAVNDFEKPPAISAAASLPVPAKGNKMSTTGLATIVPSSAGALPRPGARKAKAALYRVDPAGRIEQVFSLADGYLTGVVAQPDGSVWVSSGAQGRVHRIAADNTASLIIDLPERQILTLAQAAGNTWLGTGDAAGLYRTRAEGADAATYTSKVLDADYLSDWGAFYWLGQAVRIETRTGNTAKPDVSWNDWKALASAPGGPVMPGGGGRIGSPRARYLQYRATLLGKESRLRSVTIHFLPQNQRARITEITSGDAPSSTGAGTGSAVATAAITASVAASRAPHSAVLHLHWKVENADGDELNHRVFVRHFNATEWRPLVGSGGSTGDPITKPDYDWNTESVPDGQYQVRVTISDERSQPFERALSHTLDSSVFLVDNRKPDVTGLSAKYPKLTGHVQDAASPVTSIEMSIDGNDWRPIAPVDGLADDRNEDIGITLPSLQRGIHLVAIRATDSGDNIGANQLEIIVP